MILFEILNKNKLFYIVKAILLFLFIILLSMLNNQILNDLKRAEDVKFGISKIGYEYSIKFERYEDILDIPLEVKKTIINEVSKIDYIKLYYHEVSTTDQIIVMDTAYAKRLNLNDEYGNVLKSGCAYTNVNRKKDSGPLFFNGESIQTCGRMKEKIIFFSNTGKISTKNYSVYVVDPFFTNDGMNGTLAFSDSFSYTFDESKNYSKDDLISLNKQFEKDFNVILGKYDVNAKYFLANESAGYTSAMKHINDGFKTTKTETVCLILLLIVYNILATYYFRFKVLRFYSICLSQGISKYKLWLNELLANVLIFVIVIILSSIFISFLRIPVLFFIQMVEFSVLFILQVLLSALSIWKIKPIDILEQCASRKG